MGSEYPRKGDRRHTSGPLRHFPGIVKSSRNSLSSTAASTRVTDKVPKSALTPISRLKKFQKLRDRNLRKQVLDRNNTKKQLKMLESVESHPSDGSSVKSPQMLKELVKMENGEKENGENGLNGIEEELEVVEQNGTEENGEVRGSPRGSPRKSRSKELEKQMKESDDELEVVIPDEMKITPKRKSPEAKEIEVDVKVIESPPSTSRRRSTPRRFTPDVSSTFSDKVGLPAPDLSWRSDMIRITGRRPIRDMSPTRKRKSDEFMEQPTSKRMAFTPSIPSPGWRFLSPFSLFKKTPRAVSNRPDDSLFVNVSTSSDDDIDLDSSNSAESPPEDVIGSTEEPVERPTAESPIKSSTSWLCRLM